jgi:hypothetical protein
MANLPVSNKSELMADIEQSWTRLNTAINRLTESQLTTIRDAQGWAVKDHISHLTRWERSVVFFLRGQPRHQSLGVDEALYLKGQDDAINAAMYQQTRDIPLEEALRESRDTHQQLLMLVESLTDADLQKRYREYLPDEPGKSDAVRAVDVIVSNSARHYDEHLGWIEALVSRPR